MNNTELLAAIKEAISAKEKISEHVLSIDNGVHMGNGTKFKEMTDGPVIAIRTSDGGIHLHATNSDGLNFIYVL